jgi:hypothetical protein
MKGEINCEKAGGYNLKSKKAVASLFFFNSSSSIPLPRNRRGPRLPLRIRPHPAANPSSRGSNQTIFQFGAAFLAFDYLAQLGLRPDVYLIAALRAFGCIHGLLLFYVLFHWRGDLVIDRANFSKHLCCSLNSNWRIYYPIFSIFARAICRKSGGKILQLRSKSEAHAH